MTEGIFFNGVFRSGLDEIIAAQRRDPNMLSYLQPYSGSPIRFLRDHTPTLDEPLAAYFSTTDALGDVGFSAQIVGWLDKRELPSEEIERIDGEIRLNQPNENGLYLKYDDHVYVNLILVQRVTQLRTAFPVSHLTKMSDGKPHGIRQMAGGASHVFVPRTAALPTNLTGEQFEAQLASEIGVAHPLSDSELEERIARASPIPNEVSVTTRSFVRNPFVAELVLRRAAGLCEWCRMPAPFFRASDGSPYLEIHHVKSLAEGGVDTVENTVAVCPNCHRMAHYGYKNVAPRSI